MTRTTKVAAIALLALTLAVPAFAANTVTSSQGKNGGSTVNAARVRVVHGSPDAPAVDVWVNGAVAIPSLAFKSVTDYLTLPANRYDVQVVPAGQTSPVVIDLTGAKAASLFFRNDYTVIAAGTLSPFTIEPLVLVDDNVWVGKKTARVRFVHLSPDAPAVDVALENGPYMFRNIPFKGVGDYVKVPAGTYNVQVFVAGTLTQPIPTVTGLHLMGGKTYTVFAMGYAAASPSLTVVPVVDSPRWRDND